METAPMSPGELAQRIGASWAGMFTSTRTPQKHAHVYASAWRACDRRMTLEMTAPEAMPPYDADTLARFRRGDDRERDLLIDLQRIGRSTDPAFRVIGQQEHFEVKDRKGRFAIKGKVDARLEFGREFALPPVEVKAWSQNITQRIETFGDLFENPWTRPGAYQLLMYLFGFGVPYGFLVLDRSGLPKILAVELTPNLDRVEEFLTKAEGAIDHAQAETLPPYFDEDPNECRRCPFYGATCNPPALSAEGANVLTDPELEAKLARREELESAADEYERLDKDVKARLRGVEHGIAGAFYISGKWGKHSRVELPEDLKKQYTKTDPKGAFRLTVTRLADLKKPVLVQ
jgi:hypothetical protein